MTLRPLVLNDDSLKEIARVVAYAEAHLIDLHAIVRSLGDRTTIVGNNPEHFCIVPVGYRCVFNIEQQPLGICRHLSVSVLGEGCAPNEHLMGQFGFTGGFKDLTRMWIEELDGKKKIAINVLQKKDDSIAQAFIKE
jgi:hypothetical protein